jgi:hypothetical protein
MASTSRLVVGLLCWIACLQLCTSRYVQRMSLAYPDLALGSFRGSISKHVMIAVAAGICWMMFLWRTSLPR